MTNHIFSDSESDRESGASEFDYHSDSQSEETQHPKAIEMRNQFRNTTENLIQTLQMFFGILSFELYEGKDNLKCITMIHDITSLMEVADTKLKNYINTLNSKEQIFMVDDGVLNMDPILVADRKQNSREPLFIGYFKPDTMSFMPIGRLPNPKSHYAVVSSSTKVFIIGGMNNGTYLNRVEMFDKEKGIRVECTRLMHGRTRTSACIHEDAIYAVGGYDATYMSSVEIYDIKTGGDWTTGPSLNNRRADASVVSFYGQLFVLGGFNGKDYEETIEKLSDSKDKFEVCGNMVGRAGFGACVFRGRIYVAGGWNTPCNTLKTFQSYDPLTNTWKDEPSMNTGRKYFKLHATNEAIYAIRGCSHDWDLIKETERFDPQTLTWATS
ncbi:Kelch-like protein 10 [Caenorhabditis elegans]|uniref:Kelch-like protein 10 n=1 Tax=Caenorhabditis elegans TaxID=6239 RepID=O17702_CAEEL|nr:Kelch-like protein 10 [Caenorhabditis elegans]CAB03991.2 Kelch-like protein 10 [Caenorhabditis elegans]|eukprot:NP_506607.2 Uncharacterized protein CELE_C53A5.11 [Caenorhabditis elegans]